MDKPTNSRLYEVRVYVIYPLVVGVALAILAWWLATRSDGTNPPLPSKSADTDMPASAFRLVEAEPLPHSVNQKFSDRSDERAFRTGITDRSAFRLRIRNRTTRTVHLEKLTLAVESSFSHGSGALVSTLKQIPLKQPPGAIEVFVESPDPGDEIGIPLGMTFPPNATRDVVVWFRSRDQDAVIQISGKLQVDSVAPAGSVPIDIEIHTEINTFESNEI